MVNKLIISVCLMGTVIFSGCIDSSFETCQEECVDIGYDKLDHPCDRLRYSLGFCTISHNESLSIRDDCLDRCIRKGGLS